MEGTFAKPGSAPQADYFNDRKRTGTKTYTLEPEPFVLPRLADAEPLRSFKANVYRGQFELLDPRRKESARIAEKVDVNVTKVIHFGIRFGCRETGSTAISSFGREPDFSRPTRSPDRRTSIKSCWSRRSIKSSLTKS